MSSVVVGVVRVCMVIFIMGWGLIIRFFFSKSLLVFVCLGDSFSVSYVIFYLRNADLILSLMNHFLHIVEARHPTCEVRSANGYHVVFGMEGGRGQTLNFDIK